jgi:hypothetical protein
MLIRKVKKMIIWSYSQKTVTPEYFYNYAQGVYESVSLVNPPWIPTCIPPVMITNMFIPEYLKSKDLGHNFK